MRPICYLLWLLLQWVSNFAEHWEFDFFYIQNLLFVPVYWLQMGIMYIYCNYVRWLVLFFTLDLNQNDKKYWAITNYASIFALAQMRERLWDRRHRDVGCIQISGLHLSFSFFFFFFFGSRHHVTVGKTPHVSKSLDLNTGTDVSFSALTGSWGPTSG